MRFFISLDIPEESKVELEELQEKVKEILPSIRLTNPNKLHLTIAFIGEQSETLKETLSQAIKESVEGISSFEFTPGFLDGFPNLHHPHTLWIGTKGEVDKLYLLEERISDKLKGLNLSLQERRFVPHIALGKLKNIEINQELEENLQEIGEINLKPIKVSSVKLFESIPSEGLHKHNTLFEAKLGNP